MQNLVQGHPGAEHPRTVLYISVANGHDLTPLRAWSRNDQKALTKKKQKKNYTRSARRARGLQRDPPLYIVLYSIVYTPRPNLNGSPELKVAEGSTCREGSWVMRGDTAKSPAPTLQSLGRLRKKPPMLAKPSKNVPDGETFPLTKRISRKPLPNVCRVIMVQVREAVRPPAGLRPGWRRRPPSPELRRSARDGS